MDEIIYSSDSLNTFFANYITDVLNFDETKVLIQHSVDGNPFQKIDDNKIYVENYFVNDENSSFKNRNQRYDEDKEVFIRSQQSTRVVEFNIIFYGPDSDTLLYRLKENLYFSESKIKFENNHMFLIPDSINVTSRLFEKYGNRWWQRSDLHVSFYVTFSVNETNNYYDKFDIRIKEDF